MFSKLLNKLSDIIHILMQKEYYGFIQGHSYIEKKEIEEIQKNNSEFVIEKYEKKFSRLIGNGEAISLASARMCFFITMKAIGIKEGDEVILNGSTCAVMVNSVLRIGAVPIFSDISSSSFGSCPKGIKKVLTTKTKLIVAQHSFGIPCEIDKIKKISLSKNIFLIEDCALSVGSELMNKKIGTFANASIFSTDRSKPINSILGGLVYTEDKKLFKILKKIQSDSDSLSTNKQNLIWKEFLLERKYYNPAGNKKYNLINTISRLDCYLNKKKESPFLNEDSGLYSSKSYPYPSRLPNFIAEIGIIAIDNWESEIKTKKNNMNKYLNFLRNKGYSHHISDAYFNKQLKIVPSRFVFSFSEGQELRVKINRYVDTAWTWFLQPIVDTKEPLYKFGYKRGSCPISESIGKGMINLPINLSEKQVDSLLNKINKFF